MYETVSQSHQYDQEWELLPVTRLAKWLRIEVRLLRNAIEELEIEGVEYEINCKKIIGYTAEQQQQIKDYLFENKILLPDAFEGDVSVNEMVSRWKKERWIIDEAARVVGVEGLYCRSPKKGGKSAVFYAQSDSEKIRKNIEDRSGQRLASFAVGQSVDLYDDAE